MHNLVFNPCTVNFPGGFIFKLYVNRKEGPPSLSNRARMNGQVERSHLVQIVTPGWRWWVGVRGGEEG